MASSSDEVSDHHSHVPGFVKIIILAQAAIILSLTVWMYQEYLYNIYLQEYVVSLFRSSLIADALLSMVTVSVFALGTFTLLGSMSATRRHKNELSFLSRSTDENLDMPTMPVPEKVEPVMKAPRTSRRRQRKPRIDSEELYRSMVNHADSRRD